MKKRLLSLFLIVLIALTATACSGDQETGGETVDNVVEFNLSTPDPDSSSITIAANEFAKLVEEKSEGSIKIDVFANGSLYGADPNAAVKQLGSGTIDMLVLSTSLYSSFEPKFNAISIPYVFDDAEQFTSYLNSEIGDELMEDIGELGIKGLGYWTRSFRQITNSVRPINVPSDLDGVKLRVPNNPLWVDFFKEAGAVPTPMAFGEVYNALQLETINGQENPVDVPLASKFYEVQDYISITNHMADGWIVGMNDDKYSKLSDEQKLILEEATLEMQDWKIEYDQEQDQKAIDELVDNGMEVNEITSEQQQEFVSLSQKLYPTFRELVEDDEFFDKTMEFLGKN